MSAKKKRLYAAVILVISWLENSYEFFGVLGFVADF